jgi:hypothetical protein
LYHEPRVVQAQTGVFKNYVNITEINGASFLQRLS